MNFRLPFTFVIILMAGFCLNSCDSNRIYESNVNLPDHCWNRNNPLVFNAEIADTISAHNIYVNIRNGGQYQYSNLYLFIKTISPSGQWIRDTVEFVLANERGKWLGSGLGDIYSLQIPYKRNIRFPYPGLYSFELEQAMRTEELHDVFDIGLRIEKIVQ
jgi:gliding motility-associated lipoprotein GldH